MGRSPDKSPRKTPNRIYATVPDEEASRLVGVTLRPMHLWMLEKSVSSKEGVSPKIQAVIEQVAQEAGFTVEEWQRCQQEEKEKYLKGRRSTPAQELEKRKQNRKKE